MENVNKLKPISTAPRNRYILLAGDSGYSNTDLRFESGKWSSDKGDWVNHAGERFTDGGAEPTYWTEIPQVLEDKKSVEEWLNTDKFKEFEFLDYFDPIKLYTEKEFESLLLVSRISISREYVKKLLNKN